LSSFNLFKVTGVVKKKERRQNFWIKKIF